MRRLSEVPEEPPASAYVLHKLRTPAVRNCPFGSERVTAVTNSEMLRGSSTSKASAGSLREQFARGPRLHQRSGTGGSVQERLTSSGNLVEEVFYIVLGTCGHALQQSNVLMMPVMMVRSVRPLKGGGGHTTRGGGGAVEKPKNHCYEGASNQMTGVSCQDPTRMFKLKCAGQPHEFCPRQIE